LQEEIGTDRAEILGESRRWLKYDLPPEIAGQVWGGRYRGQRQKWFAMRFLGNDADIDIAGEHPEFSEWQWIAPARLPELIIPFKRRLYLEILAEFRAHCG
jgi:putative (di)nucleoside polyphosphate hydrolase